MKARMQVTVTIAMLFLPVALALSQHAGQDTNALVRFQNALARDGFDVTNGTTTVFNPVADWCAGTPSPGFLDTAFYANNQPYLQFVVPNPAEDSDLPPSFFRLGPTEAIVLIGLTPPPERYFGFYPFLRNKAHAEQGLAATLGDAVNNATIKTTGSTPFHSPVALIFTPDQGTDARVRAALVRAGYPEAIINTVVFPASMLNLGHGDAADQLNITMRNGVWEKGAEADGDAYIHNPPLSLFRVTPRSETIANPFPAPGLRVRGTGQTEMDLMNKLGLLRQRIIEANPGYDATDMVAGPASYEGYDYLQRGVDPMGDSRDALFLCAGYTPEYGLTNKITLGDNEFVVFYGVNHVATGKATYHGVYVYSGQEDGEVPLGGVVDRTFQGSAAPYLPDDPATAALMYAQKFSRNCGQETNCVPLDSSYCPRLQLGPGTALSFWVRMYLEPATKAGPAMHEILYDHVIKFSPRSR